MKNVCFIVLILALVPGNARPSSFTMIHSPSNALVLLSTVPHSSKSRPSIDEATRLLQQGIANYEAGRHQEAIKALQAASEGFLNAASASRYIATGVYDTLPQFETTQVYLALAHHQLKQEEEAGRAVMRLLTAEGVQPTYSGLTLEPKARAEFEAVARAAMPTVTLPEAPMIAQAVTETAGSEQPGQTAALTGSTVEPPPSPPIPTPAPPPARISTLRTAAEVEAEREAAKRAIADEIAAARASARSECETEAQRRIAEAKVAARTEADRAAEERIAALQREMEQRLVAERGAAERSVIERLEIQRVAAERAVAEKLAAEKAEVERVAAERAAAQQAAAEREVAARAGAEATALRQAQALVSAGNYDGAEKLYLELLNRSELSRPALTEIATGLYRSANFPEAARAFERLGRLRKGEEDLHYYRAIAFYETGRYRQAREELQLALPHVELTDDVARYQAKIEGAALAEVR